MPQKRHKFAQPLVVALVIAALAAGIALLAPRAKPPEETIESLQARLIKEPNNSAIHEQLASLLAQAGRQDEAITHFRAALQLTPTSANASYGLAMALAAKGEPELHEAWQILFRAALQADPDSAASSYGLAMALLAKGAAELREAWQTLEASFKLHPDDAATNEGLGDLVLKLEGPAATAQAQQFYETALQGDPARAHAGLGLSKIYLAQNRLLDAGRVLVKPLAAHDRDSALHLQMATILALLGQYDRAAVEYNTGTARDPNNSEAYCAWGVMLIDADRLESAQQVLRRAVEIKPDNPVYHVHLARALREQGRYKEALDEFAVALDKDNNCVLAYLELAITYQNAHNEKVAENFLRQGIKQVPKDLTLKVALAKFLTTAKDPLRRDPWEAATLLQTCVNETHGQDLGVLVAAADAWARVKLYDQSVALIEDALARGKTHGLNPEEQETLLWYRQQYLLALAPPMTATRSILGVEGMAEYDPVDEPWPKPLQPRVETLNKPLDLSKTPGPGTALDPDLYIGDAVKPANNMGFRR